MQRLNGSPLNAGADFLGVPIVSTTLPVRRALAYRVSKIVGEVEHVVGAYCSAVGIGEADILAPGPQEFSIPIIDDDGMSAARENVDIIFTIDADGSSIAVRVAGRKFAPVLDDLISVLCFSENDAARRFRPRLPAYRTGCDSCRRT